MLRTSLRRVAAAGAISSTGYLGYHYWPASAPQTFNVSVREKNEEGKIVKVSRPFPLMPKDAVETALHRNEILVSASATGGLRWSYSTSSLASNDPIEDASAQAVLDRLHARRDRAGDLLFFAIMDGHAGPWTSRLLAKTLIPGVALELQSLRDAPAPQQSASIPSPLRKWIPFYSPAPPLPPSASFDTDPTYVALALKTAFATLDSEIINAPYRVLAPHFAASPLGAPLDLEKHPMALPTLLPALSGSCALLAVLDTATEDLYVACTGDSRAVAGRWEPGATGGGQWCVDVLTEDQTGRNPNELKRIQSEHPADEADAVIQRGRILGGLEPSRAFGDSRYKWPAAFQRQLAAALGGTGLVPRQPPQELKTPPYVTSEPVVTHRKLQLSAPAAESSLRFMVLATDGLWDELSSAEVVALVGGHLRGLRGTVPKAELERRVPIAQGAAGVDGKMLHRTAASPGDAWAFVDDNLSTHLIRNALGGADAAKLRRMLSIPAPHARRYRDDITVTVVWWEAGVPDPQRVSAKL